QPEATSLVLEGTLVVARANVPGSTTPGHDDDHESWFFALEQDGTTIVLDPESSVDQLAAAAHGDTALVEVEVPAQVEDALDDADLAVSDLDGGDLPGAAAEILAEAPALTVTAVQVTSPEIRASTTTGHTAY